MVLVLVISFISCVCCFFIGIKQKKLAIILVAILLFIVTLFCGAVIIFKLSKTFYSSTKNKIDKKLAPRTGLEIYYALFGNANFNCVKVLNYKDQIVPKIDVSICLEFETCAIEVKRVLSLNSYNIKHVSLKDINNTNYSSDQPFWFNVKTLGNSFYEATFIDEMHLGQSKILCFSKDSTKAFYCDIAD